MAILVALKGYEGPCLLERDGERLVPIFLSRREWSKSSTQCART